MNKEETGSQFYYEMISKSEHYPIIVYFHEKDGVEYCAKHWHRSIEVACYMNTAVKVWVNGVFRDYDPDELQIFNSGDVHELFPQNNPKPIGVTLQFSDEFLEKCSISLEKLFLKSSAGTVWDAEVRKCMHNLVYFFQSRDEDPVYFLRVNGEIYKILHLLLSHYIVEDTSLLRLPTFHLERCKDILAFIEKNYSSKLSLTEIADKYGLSSGYCARYFKKYLNTTFKQHLTSVRLQKALSDVIASKKTMLEIALDNGFPDYRSFVAAFKAWYKVTPLNYRNSHEEKMAENIVEHSQPEVIFAQHIPRIKAQKKDAPED